MDHETQIEKFFNLYAVQFNRELNESNVNPEAIINCFADNFIGANPIGIQAAANDTIFREVIRNGIRFYRSIGIYQMNIVGMEITPLDNFHAMAKVHWKSLFETPEKRSGEIDFDVIYLVQLKGEDIKIFAFITGDEKEALRNNGLIS